MKSIQCCGISGNFHKQQQSVLQQQQYVLQQHQESPTQTFFRIISLLELFFLIYFASGIIDGDFYKMYIIVFAVLKHVPENIIKRKIFQFESLKSYNDRPKNAYNCNSMNAGGPAKGPGMPSGHTTVITMYFTLHLLNMLYIIRKSHQDRLRITSPNIQERKNRDTSNHSLHNRQRILNIRSIILLVIFFIGMILIIIARWYLECHTIPQIIAGWILGVLLGTVAFGISCAICEKSLGFKMAFLKFYCNPTGWDELSR
jgi:membrane-associated phospholipid phosphatase